MALIARSPLPAAFAVLFLGLVALAVSAQRLPRLVLALYLVASVLSFGAYAFDKSAARHQRRRISERSLHLLGLFGGWPGALIAQRLLHHKSAKASFQLFFRASVLLNCGALLLSALR
jgi:uncharacterized membrane protein YsdA (DUF1294 family)